MVTIGKGIVREVIKYNYFFSGDVIKGKGLGKKIGYPTANMLVKNKIKLVPGTGVYAVKTFFNQKEYLGMMNIGYRPTFNGNKQSIEINLFNFNGNLYNQNLRIHVLFKIRNEMKFQSIELLKNQISNDKKEILSILKK